MAGLHHVLHQLCLQPHANRTIQGGCKVSDLMRENTELEKTVSTSVYYLLLTRTFVVEHKKPSSALPLSLQAAV